MKPTGPVALLAHVSRQVRREALSMYYGSNTINLGFYNASTVIESTHIDKLNKTEQSRGREAFEIRRAVVTVSIHLHGGPISRLNLRLEVGVPKEGRDGVLEVGMRSVPVYKESPVEKGCVCDLSGILQGWWKEGCTLQAILANACRCFPVKMSERKVEQAVYREACGKRMWSDVKEAKFRAVG